MKFSMPIGLDEYKSDDQLKSVVLFEGYSETLLKVAVVWCIICISIGVPGNIFTVVSLIRYKKIQNATAIFIINLSLTDFLFCALILPMVLFSYWTQSWVHGRVLCRLYTLLNYVCVMVSLVTVMAIAITRYVLICHPKYYCRIYTKRNVCIMLVTLWTFAIGIILLPFFELWGRMSLDPDGGSCTIIEDKKNRNPKKIIVATVLAMVFSTILLCYIRIIMVVKKSSIKSKPRTTRVIEFETYTNNATNGGNHNDDSVVYSNSTDVSDVENGATNKRQSVAQQHLQNTHENQKKLLPTKKDKKLRTMVSAILICLFVCYVPIWLLKLFYKDITTYPTFNVIGYLLVYATPCINPVLYVFISKEYRQAYKSVFKWNK